MTKTTKRTKPGLPVASYNSPQSPRADAWEDWVMATFSIEKFEQSRKENGVVYWDARQFMRDLGYETWTSFQAIITKAMGSCTKLGIDPTESFLPASVIEDGKPQKSYKLTRFACFLISMHADSKKTEVAQAKTVLAAIADKLIAEKIQENDLARIEAREDLKEADKLMSAAGKAGGLVNGDDYAIFKNAGFLGMYNMSLKALLQKKGLPDGERLYDYIGLTELAGNLFRVTQTTEVIRSQKLKGLNNLKYTAEKVGADVRKMMIANTGAPPEALPIENKVTEVRKKLNKTHREMKKLDKAKT
jgi:DNA-damage-inducible protein D